MFTEFHRKVRAEHLRRDTFLYVRQSTPRQILKNAESTKRQYALRDRAVALGWPIERVHTIDHDQGRSGARAESRDGFEKLVSEVVLGRAGILLGLEVSRLARNDADWQRLLELCALYGCLVGDEDGVYDPTDFNDRLLLGLKGTISAAELHVLTARLAGGLRNKARRGALELPLPIGLVYNAAGAVILDPDPQVQASVRLVFDTFRQTHSAHAVQDRFRREGLQFPRRTRREAGKGRLLFGALEPSRVLQILHNPRYAGAFVYGRNRVVQKIDSQQVIPLARKDWRVLIQNAHPGYIAWEEFESNEQILQNNLTQFLRGRPRGGPHKHAGLLQGRVLCGVCGTRMQVRYDWRDGQRILYYTCQESPTARRGRSCRWIAAPEVETAIGTLLLQTVTSTAIHSALAIQDKLTRQIEQAETRRRRALEQLRHRADVKRRRFANCDPDHRLVADALEADWNEALRQLDALQQEHVHQRQAGQVRLDEESRTRVSCLAQDFPRVWNDPGTAPHERNRMLGLLIEDVTLIQGDPVTVHVRFRGGHMTSLSVPRPPAPPRASKVSPEVIRELDRLLENYPDSEAATRLNALGYRNWLGQPFTTHRVTTLRQRAGLKSRFERLRAQGFLTVREMARELDLCVEHTHRLAHAGVLPTQHYGKGQRYLFAPLNGAVFVRGHGGPYVSTQPRLIPAADSPQVTKTAQR
jgi:DNA invertase Pin-like site-specific DNA recombinase